MFDWFVNHTDEETLFVDSTDAQLLRARRVWEFIVVLWSTWIFFAIFLCFRGYYVASCICVIDSVVHLLLAVWFRKHHDYRLIMNLNLLASAFGLFFVSVTDPAMSATMLFFPVSILVASQLLGVRSAFYWLLVNIAALTLFHFYMYGFDITVRVSWLDELVLQLGVAVCTFVCCLRGEEYYALRTESLIRLSQELQEESKRLHRLATTDALTGLINRFQFQEKMKEAVLLAQNGGPPVALFLLDMDGFKEINDTLGHTVGDDALVEIGRRLNQVFGQRAEVARLGGDEFCIIYRGIDQHEYAAQVSELICDILSKKYVLSEAEFHLGVSVGVAIAPGDATCDRDLLAFADTAMFHAKENRLGHACYKAEMTDRLVEYRTMQELLSHALDKNEFFIVYQPQVDLHTNVVTGVEALLRWRHNDEVIPPYRFIKLLEDSGEIIRVSRWIVGEACQQLADWNREGYQVNISINLSAMQFQDSGFRQCVADSTRQCGIKPSDLDFEITEGMLVENVQQAVEMLNALKEMGASISVDDFGTGYSSLAYLRQFPIDRLKIDRAFIKDIPDGDDGQIAASIIVLARALGMKVLAEGAETEAHLKFLRDHDCDEYQGYFLSPPVPPEKVVQFFQRAASPTKVE
ncbi:putative bifunctional diguanylate cyclase/phosphodiesterase [Lignipirellula cremea]|uniref:Phytochrome-like protein cph2 n=1 Tax=Lignipirellula cremea TaxID=2528010 RepID=A0A518DPS8_9BACT|nr:bifunctional diguanylate cyclase/phosphodiesterase [Lignipirellula cremea]QDU93836.1 Phytochrome-like protein cph2 [Lignipirellula cremea]